MPEAEVHYCYQCGRHTSQRPGGKCWYCGSPTIREIRPPRRCPYCDQVIRHKAVKCHQCGELIDEDLRKEKIAEQPKSATFVIDKAIIQQGEVTAALPAPGPAADPSRGIDSPPPAAPLELPAARVQLDAPAAKGEEPPGEPGPRELAPIKPAPETAPAGDSRELETIDVGGAESKESRELERGGPRGELAVREEASPSDFLPALWDATRRGLGAVGRALAKPPPDTAVDVAEIRDEDRYRLCGVCGTEILRSDNYCYHCGQKFSRDAAAAGPARPGPWRFTLTLFGVAAAMVAANIGVVTVLDGRHPEPARIAALTTTFAVLALAGMGVIRGPGLLGRLASIAFALACLAAIVRFGSIM